MSFEARGIGESSQVALYSTVNTLFFRNRGLSIQWQYLVDDPRFRNATKMRLTTFVKEGDWFLVSSISPPIQISSENLCVL